MFFYCFRLLRPNFVLLLKQISFYFREHIYQYNTGRILIKGRGKSRVTFLSLILLKKIVLHNDMINKHKRLTAYFKFKILTQKYFKNSTYDMPLIYKTIYFLMHQIKHIKKLDNT